ncbi:MAG TPA: prenyltransferase [Candidatus Limnocylindria bacterium]|nr:prenyltransferase [Candidatus Limnocylindria bacterium]
MSTTTSPVEGAPSQPMSLRTRFSAWAEIMQTANAPIDKPLDTIGKWLVMTRAAVFPMTLWSGTIGALLAVEQARIFGNIAIDWLGVVLAVVGIVLAHAANNLINDYFDQQQGIDSEGYVRALYAPHPVLSGWITRAGLRNAILALTAIDGVIMIALALRNPQPLLLVGFALAGLFLSVFYVAPPFSLKRRGLGELDVFLTWGPLMIGGTYLVATGTIPLWVIVFSMPYALLVTSVLFGKHIDKIVPDTALGIRTLPVILGEPLARRTGQILMIAFYPLLAGAVLAGWVGPWVLLGVLAIPELVRALRFFNKPKPDAPPAWYPARGWPLWFVGFAFRHVRLAGGLLTLGLFLNIVFPISLPLPRL